MLANSFCYSAAATVECREDDDDSGADFDCWPSQYEEAGYELLCLDRPVLHRRKPPERQESDSHGKPDQAGVIDLMTALAELDQ
ncbi:uncharacterized protein CLUP02_03439 [Colletotrichum lupini]|uniref:Uncharacterized protein n=1 Tax=Colletotrichum lupini TaxID=145971 RepID=A0A9Q8SJC4_9PEZI|nr:uncharacterized protein CLUP02_03439 [Colletotrichum lupini]UQC77966.1 hypothetical protein CLUP02_03439 [Colletotrichum lupini]